MKKRSQKLFATLSLFISTVLCADSNASIDLLKAMVNISSESENTSGVKKVQEVMGAKLTELGFKVKLLKNPDKNRQSGPLLVAEYPGRSHKKYLTLLGHADTVFPAVSDMTISADNKTASGSGVIDDKGGLVIAYQALTSYLERHHPEHPIRFIISPSEETGTSGFHELLKEYGENSIAILGVEPSLDDGSIISSRNGNRWYLIKVTGRSAHAGRDHNKGINAILELSNKILELSKLTDYKQGRTVNLGSIKGGNDKYNIVADTAEAKVDTRFKDNQGDKYLNDRITTILKSQYVHAASDNIPAITTFQIADYAPAMAVSKRSEFYVDKYLAILGQLEGIQMKAQLSKGSADINYLVTPDLILIDGLGPTGSGMHTKEETIILDSLKTRSEALANFLAFLDQKAP